MPKYLKEDAYYNDLYDLFTVRECLSCIESWNNTIKEKSNAKELKKHSEEDKARYLKSALNMSLFHIKGGRYKNRSSAIRKWMDKDRGLDEKLDSTQDPQDVSCPQCGKRMDIMFKDLYDHDSLRVLFFFECPACKKRKGLFDNGEAFVSRPQHCPRCKKEIKVSCVEKNKVLRWITNCKSCGYKETEIDDFEKEKAVRLEKEAKNRELLKKHRSEFCLSAAEGQEYIETISRMELIAQYIEKADKKRTNPDYKKVSKLKRLSVVELEKLITETMEKEKYSKLMLEKPDIDRYVIVPFTMQDADSSRVETDSVRRFQRIVKKTLEETNWRLMSEGVHYRLGYLSGKLKGYEQEEDLLLLVKGHEKNKLEEEHERA